MSIENKVAIITGASSGIGRATARLLAQRGARVVLTARSKDALETLSAELPDALAVPADVTDGDAVTAVVKKAHQRFGRIDILINNAGMGYYGAVADLDIETFRRVNEVNVIAPLRLMQAVIPVMRAQGGGTILNVSSLASKGYYPLIAGYAATKHALNAITLTARAELERDGIVVGLMLPGYTDTPFNDRAIRAEGAQLDWLKTLPAPDSPEHIAGRILQAIETGDAETYPRDRKPKPA